MRIAVWHSLPHGGARRALFLHLKALKEAGNDIEIWTTDFYRNEFLSFEEFGKEHMVPVGTDAGALHYHYKNPPSISTTRKTIRTLKQVQRKAADEINARGFDLAFVNSCSVSYMPFIAEFLKVPSVLYLGEPFRWLYEASPHNVWQAPEYKPYQIKKIIKDYVVTYSKRIQVSQEIASARLYTKILVNSFYSKESVIKAYGIEPEVCRLGVNTELFTNNDTAAKDNYVVGIGVLYPPKGTDRAISLLSKIDSSIRPKLYWICNAADPNYVKQMTEYAAEKKVEFVPLINIKDHELVNWVSKARFMIYTPRLEPLGLAPLEANACGTFVIGIAEAGVRETIRHEQNGFLIDGVNDDRFIEYAGVLLKDNATSVKLGLQARQFVIQHWSFTHLKNNINSAVNSVSPIKEVL